MWLQTASNLDLNAGLMAIYGWGVNHLRHPFKPVTRFTDTVILLRVKMVVMMRNIFTIPHKRLIDTMQLNSCRLLSGRRKKRAADFCKQFGIILLHVTVFAVVYPVLPAQSLADGFAKAVVKTGQHVTHE